MPVKLLGALPTFQLILSGTLEGRDYLCATGEDRAEFFYSVTHPRVSFRGRFQPTSAWVLAPTLPSVPSYLSLILNRCSCNPPPHRWTRYLCSSIFVQRLKKGLTRSSRWHLFFRKGNQRSEKKYWVWESFYGWRGTAQWPQHHFTHLESIKPGLVWSE